MTAPARDELREHLVQTMIAGDVATPRQNNLKHYRLMADGEPYYQLGLELKPSWTERTVLEMMVERCGVDPDPGHVYGDDTIDPDITLDMLEAMGERVGLAARRAETVLIATGHPATLSPVYQAVAHALAGAGCRVLTPAEGWTYEIDAGWGGSETRRIVYAEGGVAMLEGDDGRTHHTHDPRPMEAMLRELATGEPAPVGRVSVIAPDGPTGEKTEVWPDLAIADHGWAGAAGQAGIDTVGFADCNDPALFAGAAEGKIDVVVPLDDGVSPHHYAPMTAYLLGRAGLLPSG
ncbi:MULTISPECIES: phosphatase [Actinomadura]|uniref:Phosphatase n=1 Tax=Actinomadura litoris TaxID=2678616 RepID=A0A7K1KTR0_9ACTN|nr:MULTISPECIES: phosphatase [Actinomadura]MBT2207632.1 phosphatase [Actinomadura sp. NEAU-AAG7]MUN35574.1 phosphatase [Actinomadura litoris]